MSQTNAFQADAFQNDAFQVLFAVFAEPLGYRARLTTDAYTAVISLGASTLVSYFEVVPEIGPPIVSETRRSEPDGYRARLSPDAYEATVTVERE